MIKLPRRCLRSIGTTADNRMALPLPYNSYLYYELLQTLLAFGPEVKVMEPESLKHELKGMLEKSLGLYERENIEYRRIE